MLSEHVLEAAEGDGQTADDIDDHMLFNKNSGENNGNGKR